MRLKERWLLLGCGEELHSRSTENNPLFFILITRVHYVHRYIETEFADVRADMFMRGHIHYIAMQAGHFMTIAGLNTSETIDIQR